MTWRTTNFRWDLSCWNSLQRIYSNVKLTCCQLLSLLNKLSRWARSYQLTSYAKMLKKSLKNLFYRKTVTRERIPFVKTKLNRMLSHKVVIYASLTLLQNAPLPSLPTISQIGSKVWATQMMSLMCFWLERSAQSYLPKFRSMANLPFRWSLETQELANWTKVPEVLCL